MASFVLINGAQTGLFISLSDYSLAFFFWIWSTASCTVVIFSASSLSISMSKSSSIYIRSENIQRVSSKIIYECSIRCDCLRWNIKYVRNNCLQFFKFCHCKLLLSYSTSSLLFFQGLLLNCLFYLLIDLLLLKCNTLNDWAIPPLTLNFHVVFTTSPFSQEAVRRHTHLYQNLSVHPLKQVSQAVPLIFTQRRKHSFLHFLKQCSCNTLIKLQNNITCKCFTDNDICCSVRNISCLNTSNEITVRTFFNSGKLPSSPASISFFSTDIHDTNCRILLSITLSI